MQLRRLQQIIRILVLVVMICSGVLQAAGEPATLLTLEQALRFAMDQNPNTQASKLDHAKAVTDLDIAWRNLFPKANLQTSYVRLDEGPVIPTLTGFDPILMQPIFTEVEGSPNLFNTQISVQQPLFVGGKAMLGIEMAELGVTMTEIQARSNLNDIFFQVIQSYFNLLLAEQMVQIQQSALKLIEEHLQIVEVNYKQGLTLRTDLLKVELEQSKAVQSLQSAKNALYLTQRHLGILLGRNEGVKGVEATGWIPEMELNLESLYTGALQSRPELQLMDMNLQMLEHNLTMEKRSYWPNVILAGTYNWKGDTFTLKDGHWNLTLSASMPLYDGGISAKKQQGLEVQIEKTRRSANHLNSMIGLEIEEALMKVDEARESLRLQQQSLANAEENLRIAEKAFALDAGTSLEVLNAQSFVQQAGAGVIQSQYQYQIGLFKVLYKTGQLVDYCKEVIYREK